MTQAYLVAATLFFFLQSRIIITTKITAATAASKDTTTPTTIAMTLPEGVRRVGNTGSKICIFDCSYSPLVAGHVSLEMLVMTGRLSMLSS